MIEQIINDLDYDLHNSTVMSGVALSDYLLCKDCQIVNHLEFDFDYNDVAVGTSITGMLIKIYPSNDVCSIVRNSLNIILSSRSKVSNLA